MSRNQHTLTRFKGVDYTSSVANVPPDSALDSLNVYGDAGGYLSQFQQPSILCSPAGKDPGVSLGQLPSPGKYARLFFQQGTTVLYSDFPYAVCAPLDHGLLAGIAARLDYAFCNGLLYFSNGQDTGYAIPASSSNQFTSRFGWGILPPVSPTLILPSTCWIPGSITVQRTAGVTTVTFASAHSGVVGSPCFVDSDLSAPWPVTFQGLFPIATTPSASILTYLQPGLPDTPPYTRAAYPSGITATTGWQYGACYGSSPVRHWSSLSPLSVLTGPVTAQSPTIYIPASVDVQVDQSALFRNQDSVVPGGGSWFLVSTVTNIAAGPYAGGTVYFDTMSDDTLATSGQTAPYDNGVAPQGKYLAVWLDRVLMCGIGSDPSGVRFTGYDSINFGRPQMSWCQFNEVKLGQGQATPMGMGLLRYGGMVFFGDNGLMYIYRGTLNDITVSSPVSLSFYAEQMPYHVGLFSHFSIQPSPAGLIWLDDGFNLRVMDNTGFYPPKLLAPNLSSLFKRITPGSADKVSSVHINYLQRDWYILSICVDGSPIPNMTVVVDVTQDPAKNMGAFPVNHSITDMQMVVYPDKTSHLLAAQPQLTSSNQPPASGYITEIPLLSPIVAGAVSASQSALAPPNLPMPGAFWQGGYFGIRDEQGEDEFSMVKLFRFLRWSGSPSLSFLASIVNDEDWTFDAPSISLFQIDGFAAGLNMKGRAISPIVRFPDTVLATLSSLTMAWVVASER